MTFRRMAWRELVMQLRIFWRDGSTLSLTVIFPVVSLAFVMALNAGARVPAPGRTITTGLELLRLREVPEAWVSFTSYGAAGMVVLGLAVACFAHVAIGIATARESGELKRVRTTPLPLGIYLFGKIGSAIVVGVALGTLLLGVSAIRYGVPLQPRMVPGLIGLIVLGATIYAALGVALSAAIWTSQTAHAVAYALLIPVVLASSLFHSPQVAPAVLRAVGGWLPLQPLVRSLFGLLGPDGLAPQLVLSDLLRLFGWGAGGLLLAVYSFRWTPAHESVEALSRLDLRRAQKADAPG